MLGLLPPGATAAGDLRFALGGVLLEVPTDPRSTEFERAQANLARLQASPDAAGRALQIDRLDPAPDVEVSYADHYLANGAVIVPVGGDDRDERILEFLAGVHPDREIVGVPGETIAFGGGGPHCITQQVPVGA